ncbi:hypothetical protein AKJ60_00930 [candidate division MSBL1 archaeon SCGC-AAA385M11]|nr:hypothetical protein AKJ60_00930 [candidate division MSBL1 archaeon SCGC-AAA385M11]
MNKGGPHVCAPIYSELRAQAVRLAFLEQGSLMLNWIAISLSQHATKYFLPRQRYFFASGQQVIPILLAELAKLIPHYSLGFIHQDDTYQPVVLTGLGGGQNLYVNHDGKWLASYVPAFLRSHPFRLLTNENNNLVFCIHEEHLVDNTQGRPLFDQEGNLTEPVQETLNFLNECENNRKVNQAAGQALYKAGVIEKWPLQIQQQEGQEPLKVEGLYRISEQSLNELDAPTFAGLRKSGALALAYAQLFSMNQINRFTELAKYHAKQRPPQPEEIDWGEDDRLWIDWDKL